MSKKSSFCKLNEKNKCIKTKKKEENNTECIFNIDTNKCSKIIKKKSDNKLYSFFLQKQDLKTKCLQYLDQQTDYQHSKLKILSNEFNYLPIFTKYNISTRLSKSEILDMFKINKINTIAFYSFNKNFLSVPVKYLSFLKIIKFEDFWGGKKFDEKNLQLLFNHIPNHIIELDIENLDIKIPLNILKFTNIESLSICFYEQNEDVLFDLLELNQKSLKKLIIKKYFKFKTLNVQKLNIILNKLNLEYIDFPRELFNYDFVKYKTKYIENQITFDILHYKKLTYIKSLDIENVTNIQLQLLAKNCIYLENVHICGIMNNIEIAPPEIVAKNAKIHNWWNEIKDDYEYDGLAPNIEFSSNNLHHLILCKFTIKKLSFLNIDSIKTLKIRDVNIKNKLYLPKLKEFEVDNNYINSETFNYKNFKFPQLQILSLEGVLVNKYFSFHKLNTLWIQLSIIDVDIIKLLKKNKKITSCTIYNDLILSEENEINSFKYIMKNIKKYLLFDRYHNEYRKY
jgi:hypothetical protein